jgi:quercetin dioxygenase-like cupin family protein
MDERQRIAIRQFISDRTPRPLAAPLLAFDLRRELAALRAEFEPDKRHNARTLIKFDGLRVVLVALNRGAQIQEHESSQPLAFHLLSGELRLQLGDDVSDVHPEQLVSVDRQSTYTIEALADSELLVWVG